MFKNNVLNNFDVTKLSKIKYIYRIVINLENSLNRITLEKLPVIYINKTILYFKSHDSDFLEDLLLYKLSKDFNLENNKSLVCHEYYCLERPSQDTLKDTIKLAEKQYQDDTLKFLNTERLSKLEELDRIQKKIDTLKLNQILDNANKDNVDVLDLTDES